MTDTLKVLVWGSAEEGPCAFYRGYMYDEPLKALGIEQRHIQKLDFIVDPAYKGREAEAMRLGKIELDKAPIEWADIVVFRRYYNTSLKCGLWTGPENAGCGYTTRDENDAAAHEHGYKRQDDITRAIWPLFRDTWTGGVIYETDDDHRNIRSWNGYYKDVVAERDLIAEMTRRADLVTVATPALAKQYGRYNKNIRVIRNSLVPEMYVKDTSRPEGDLPRLVYYGSTARLRDYAGFYVTRDKKADGPGYAYQAVEAHKHLLRRVFLGTNEGSEEVIRHFFDEQTPYIVGIAAFAKALANAHGDIGIAPLGGDDFDRSKSELHWLEYALSDMAFIGQRFNGDGPYQVVRDGVDGLLARGAQEWHDAVGRLAKSKDLREQLAGAAKERVLREYDYRQRAEEWAAAYRWAAENARGALASAA